MQSPLRELLTGLIDHAGLLPPAELPLDVAVRNYLDHRAGPDAWMLGRFVIPAARLHELTDVGAGLSISALGRGGADAAPFVEGLKADLADIERCRMRFSGRVVIDVLETKPPWGMFVDTAPARAAGLRVFLEQPAGTVPWIRDGEGTGQKLRAGGPEAFPSCGALALSLAYAMASTERRVPVKVAGLHHPFHLVDAKIGERRHGFVNTFVAGLMLSRLDFSEADAEELLAAPAEEFTVSDTEIRWRDRRPLDAADIREGWKLMTSFAACSVERPRDNLRAMGWM